MVSSSERDGNTVIIAKPNQSATWRSNQLALLAISVPSLGAAISFALMGAWPIIPFAGFELLALGGALYYVNWKLQYRHVITLSENQILIDKGFYAPRRSWCFDLAGASLSIIPAQHPWDGPSLAVYNREETVSVGEFLNRDDALALQALLRKALRVGTQGRHQQIEI